MRTGLAVFERAEVITLDYRPIVLFGRVPRSPLRPFGQRAFLRQWKGGADHNWLTLLGHLALFLLPSIWALAGA